MDPILPSFQSLCYVYYMLNNSFYFQKMLYFLLLIICIFLVITTQSKQHKYSLIDIICNYYV